MNSEKNQLGASETINEYFYKIVNGDTNRIPERIINEFIDYIGKEDYFSAFESILQYKHQQHTMGKYKTNGLDEIPFTEMYDCGCLTIDQIATLGNQYANDSEKFDFCASVFPDLPHTEEFYRLIDLMNCEQFRTTQDNQANPRKTDEKENNNKTHNRGKSYDPRGKYFLFKSLDPECKIEDLGNGYKKVIMSKATFPETELPLVFIEPFWKKKYVPAFEQAGSYTSLEFFNENKNQILKSARARIEIAREERENVENGIKSNPEFCRLIHNKGWHEIITSLIIPKERQSKYDISKIKELLTGYVAPQEEL